MSARSSTLRIPTARVFRPLLEPARYKGAWGGRGSGKSWFFAGLAVERCFGEPGTRIVCVREVQRSLKESVKLLVEDQIEALGLAGAFKATTDSIRGPGGGLILFQGMQDHTAESIKSLEGMDVGYVEEAQTLTQRSLEFLRPTIRKAGSELWFSWNPRHASDPVDTLLRGMDPPPDARVVRTSYKENPFFPAVLEDERAFDEQQNRARYAHVWLGDYEPAAIGAIWDRLTLHQGRVAEAPEMARIVVAVDPAVSSEENANETGIVVAGIGTDGRGYVLADVSLRGGPQQWADRAVAAFDRYDADAVVVEVNQGGDMVRHTLHGVRPGLRVIEVRATRGKHVRAEPIAALYTMGRISHVGAFPELEGQMCLVTAGGYEGEGSPDRCLAAGTIIETASGGRPIEDISAGDLVLTRGGYRRVLDAGQTGSGVPVLRVGLSNGGSIVGTGNHPVFVAGRGFISLDALGRDDILTSCTDRHAKSASFSTAGSTFATLTRRIGRFACISITRLVGGVATVAARCTGMSGQDTTGQFRQAVSSTTRTTTRSIMIWIISNAYRMPSTRAVIRRLTRTLLGAWITLAFMRVLGMAAKRVALGILNTAGGRGIGASQSLEFASNAGLSMGRWHIVPPIGFARANAFRATTSGRGATTRIAGALSAAERSTSKNQSRRPHAPVSVVGLSDAGRADVYNLTVEGAGEYFGNGILVHNCDALVWAFTELFPRLVRKQDTKGRRPTRANSQYSPHRWPAASA